MDCSAKNRRSMSQALRTPELGDEALAFVAGRTAAPKTEIPAATPRKQALPSRDVDFIPLPQPPNSVQDAVSLDAKPDVEGVASITVRLPASLPALLLRASVERKLRRKLPFTQQDIVADALRKWLSQHEELK